MAKKNEAKRGFIWSSRAWYVTAARCQHEIAFGMYYDEGGTRGAMSMVWQDLGKGRMCPELMCFDDAWAELHSFSDVLARMADVDSQDITEELFVAILKDCGFEDMTDYDGPKGG